MKILLIILALTLNIKKFHSQIITDNFTSVGGANQWYKAFGGPNMGVESGSLLCYNVASSYVSNTNYSFESPDYSSIISSSNCLSLDVSFRAAGVIRNSDVIVFCTYNGSWTCYNIPITSVMTVYTINLPVSNYKFSFDLYTGNSGNLTGKYSHIDWFKIYCVVNMPIELLEFNGIVGNNLTWITATEKNNDYFVLESSIDGIDWQQLFLINGAGTSITNNNYSFVDINYVKDTVNYYRLSQVDYNGDTEVFTDRLVAIDNRQRFRAIVMFINLLGQQVLPDTKGVVIIVYNDGSLERYIN